MTPAWRRAWVARLGRVGGGRRFPKTKDAAEYIRQFCLLNGLTL